MLLVRLDDPGFVSLAKIRSKAKIRSNFGLDWLSCTRGIFLELLILGRLPVDELVAAQINLTFERIARPRLYPVSDKFPLLLLRYTPVLTKSLKRLRLSVAAQIS